MNYYRTYYNIFDETITHEERCEMVKELENRAGVYMFTAGERVMIGDICSSCDTFNHAVYIGQSANLYRRFVKEHFNNYKISKEEGSIGGFFNMIKNLGYSVNLHILELPEEPFNSLLRFYSQTNGYSSNFLLEKMENYWIKQFNDNDILVWGIGKHNQSNKETKPYIELQQDFLDLFGRTCKKITTLGTRKIIQIRAIQKLINSKRNDYESEIESCCIHIPNLLEEKPNPFTTSNIAKKIESVPALLRPVSQDQPNPFVSPNEFKSQRIVAAVLSVPEVPVKPEKRITPNPFTNPQDFKAQLDEVRGEKKAPVWKKPVIDHSLFDFLEDFTKITQKNLT